MKRSGCPGTATTGTEQFPGATQTVINGISRRGYTGHSMLGSMGLIHMNGRVQDALTGTVPLSGSHHPESGLHAELQPLRVR